MFVKVAALSLVALLALLAGFFIWLLGYIVYIRRKYAHLPGPPVASFWGGHLADIRQAYKSGDFSHRVFLKWAEEYSPFFKVFIFHKCMVIITSHNVVKEVLTKSKYTKSRDTYHSLGSVCGTRFLGRGLVTNTDHKEWMKRRSTISPVFHKKYLAEMVLRFNQVADGWINKLHTVADGKTYINLATYVTRVTLDVICQVGFGMKTKAVQEDSYPLTSALLTVLEALSKQLRDPILQYRPSQQQSVRHARKCVGVVRTEAKAIVQERAERLLTNKPIPNDISSFVVKCLLSLPYLQLDDLVDDFTTLLVAGQETTANSLSFLFKELGRRPEVLHRLKVEMDQVLDGETDLTYELLQQMTYMNQVVQETLRLYPPAPGTVRENRQEAVIEGYYIPPNTKLVISFFVMHRLSRYYEEPEEFNPARFHKDAKRTLYTFMPFSIGLRSCAGKNFAQNEIKVLLCKFLQSFTYELDPDQPFTLHEMSTLRPQGGTLVKLTPL